MALVWQLLHPHALDLLGYLPQMFTDEDPAPVAEQIHKNYPHGGGWRSFKGFKKTANHSLIYPGDPPQRPIARVQVRDELVLVYPHAWVVVIQPDGSWDVARID